MARIRSIKPETFTSETLCHLSIAARWTFAGIWTYADDEGRGKADPRLIKAAIWPLDDTVTPKHIDGYIDEMERVGLVCRYQSDRRNLLHVVSFGEHQHPSKPQPSKFPPCPKESHGTFPEESGNGGGTLPVGIGGEGSSSSRSKETAAKPPRADVERLCRRLSEKMVENGCKEPTITTSWRDSARRLLDTDQRPFDEAMRLIDWCQQDNFWKGNIRSLPTFREKYDQLRLKAGGAFVRDALPVSQAWMAVNQ